MTLLVGATIIKPIQLNLITPNNNTNDNDNDIKLSNMTLNLHKTKINGSSNHQLNLYDNFTYNKHPFGTSRLIRTTPETIEMENENFETNNGTIKKENDEELKATHRNDELIDTPQQKDIDEAIEYGLKMMNDLHFIKEPSLYEMGKLFFFFRL